MLRLAFAATLVCGLLSADTLTLNPSSQTAGSAGGTFTLQISTFPSNLSWSASSNAAWIFLYETSGKGNSTFYYNIARNNTGQTRSGTISINGVNFIVSQSAQETLTLNPTSASFSSAGGTATIAVTASSTTYRWTASTAASWITITSGATGTGSSQIQYTVQPNTDIARQDVIFIGDASFITAFTVTQSAASGGLGFIPITPCRAADTRNSNVPLAAGETRTFNLGSSACGIPSTATAFAINVTVVPRTGSLGYLTLFPAGQSRPLASTLNSADGRIKANNTIVASGYMGAVNVYATDATDVILDISGYFVPYTVSAGTSALAYYPMASCRLADTRISGGANGAPGLSGGQTRSFVSSNGSCQIPTSARAYVLNITAVPSGGLGYMTVWPAGAAMPLASTLNSPKGQIVANSAIVPAGNGGAISVFSTDFTDVVIDVSGYFAVPGSAGAASFYPLTPCRVVDTRNAAGPYGGPILSAGQTRGFDIRGSGCGAPSSATGFALNATVVPSGPLGYLTMWSPAGSDTGVPLISLLNSPDGSIVSNGAIIGVGAGITDLFATNNTHLVLDLNGYFAP